MGSGKGDSLKELEEAVAEAESDSEEAEKPLAEAAPEDDSPAPEMQAISEVEPIEADMGMEEMPMDDGLDLSSDEVTKKELDVDDEQVAEELLAGLEEPEGDLDEAEAADAMEDALEGFSLDDFAPDSLEDDSTDEEEPKP